MLNVVQRELSAFIEEDYYLLNSKNAKFNFWNYNFFINIFYIVYLEASIKIILPLKTAIQ